MQEELKISIATGASSRTRVWSNKDIYWSDLVEQLSASVQRPYTLREFLNKNKDDQHAIKDVGGYVGAYLKGGRRNPKNVVYRQLLTLDVDFATSDFFEDFKMLYGNAAFIHATHKHSPADPRFRLIIPLDRECVPDEYVAVGRRVAGNLGIDKFDNTTFEVNRLMFWPSHPKDVTYYCEEQRGPFLNVDQVLGSYKDWKDSSLWPTAEKKLREIGTAAKEQEDPCSKKGVIGAFCRTYGIAEAIAAFLSEEYVGAVDGRYTYTKGSTSCGVVVYDDTFAYSHHSTDPASGKLCNAFDLVRLHKYSNLDTDGKESKSFAAMESFASQDPETRKTFARENLEDARLLFGDELEDVTFTEEEFDWMKELEMDTKMNYLSSAGNITMILQKDRVLKEAFRQNEFDSRLHLFRKMPWRHVGKSDPVRNVDFAGLRNYIESVYKISSKPKIDDALMLEAERLRYHPIREYLTSLAWDGVPRVDDLLIEYFGAEPTEYTRHAIRKTLVGAVARIMQPGCKFDLSLVLVGGQGTYKSSFLHTLGGDWFSDTFSTVQGREALEQLRGAWIIEVAELAAMKRADVETTKHFITKQRDQYRPAYGQVTEIYPRQCVFICTTNEDEFLKDPTGGRRWLPIDVRQEFTTKSVMKDFPAEVDQVWAEAVDLYENGEPWYLENEEVQQAAVQQQAAHSEVDERTGVIERYLNMKLPEDWDEKDVFERQEYIRNGGIDGTEMRRFVCVAEIWCECLEKRKDDMSRYATKEINNMMRSFPGWKAHISTTKNFGLYGTQRYYERLK